MTSIEATRKEDWVLFSPGFRKAFPNDYVACGWDSGELKATNRTVEVIILACERCGCKLIDGTKRTPRWLEMEQSMRWIPTKNLRQELLRREKSETTT